MPHELGAMAVSGLLARTGLPAERVDRLILGTVIAEPRTSNVAREVALISGLPDSCPAYTVTAACVSSNVAISNAVEAIAAGAAEVVIAGGTESLSDVPIRVSRALRRRLLTASKMRGVRGVLSLVLGLKLRDLKPEALAIAEFSTGLTMGENAERLAKRFGISRAEQDAFALDSHKKAAKATQEGLFEDQILPVFPPPAFARIAQDNGVRKDSTLEKLSALPPVFDRASGTVTAGNSSFLTDGAAACLLMSENAARELGYEPLAAFLASTFVALDPVEELLLGPFVSIPPALSQASLVLEEVDVFEIHEAFSVPVLAAVQLLANEAFCRERLGLKTAVGAIDPLRLNAWGGSLAVGHPFGATGARLVMTCARRLRREGGRFGLVSACAAGGLGHTLILERLSSGSEARTGCAR